jgi:polyketide synthase 12
VLPEAARAKAGAAPFGIHPALFDAALHALASLVAPPSDVSGTLLKGTPEHAAPGAVLLPVAWSEVTLHAAADGELRVRLDLEEGDGATTRATLLLADAAGAAVAEVGRLELRRVSAEDLAVKRLAARAGGFAPTSLEAVLPGDGAPRDPEALLKWLLSRLSPAELEESGVLARLADIVNGRSKRDGTGRAPTGGASRS